MGVGPKEMWVLETAEPPRKLMGLPFGGTFTGFFAISFDLQEATFGAPGLTTRSMDATRGPWHRY